MVHKTNKKLDLLTIERKLGGLEASAEEAIAKGLPSSLSLILPVETKETKKLRYGVVLADKDKKIVALGAITPERKMKLIRVI